MPAQERLLYRFGVYELDPTLLELRRNGSPVKLREQACRILLLLLERPGELVTREELRKRLWTDDTFVNFDKSLNTAINTLRETLDDDANVPKYVQTAPRRGYRFIAKVEVGSANHEVDFRNNNTSQHRNRTVAILLFAALGILGAALWGRRFFSQGSGSPTLRVTPIATNTGQIRSPSLSPDGAQVAYSWKPEGAPVSNIYVQTIGAPEPLRLTNASLDDIGPNWSPDGTQIAFLRSLDNSTFDVMVVPPTGGAPRKLTTLNYPIGYLEYQQELLAWMPDGKSLLFPDAGESERTAIWRIDLRTAERTQLTNPESPVIGHSLPNVRPDGGRLVYQRVGGPCFFSLLTVALGANGNPVGATSLIACGYNTAPIGWIGDDLLFSHRSPQPTFFERWSPSSKISDFDIPDVDAMAARIGSVSGSITRDGRRMAIGMFRWDVHIWRADLSNNGTGENQRRLIVSTFRDLNPSYSPDGSLISFKSTRSGGDNAWIAKADGTGLRQLTHSGDVGYPRWSPDGKSIVFNGGSKARGNVFIINPETAALRQLTHGPSSDIDGHWSPDSQWIYFGSDRTGRSEIWKVLAAGGDEVQVTKNGGSNPMESPDGQYLYYGKGKPGNGYVWRMELPTGKEERLFPSHIDTQGLGMGCRHLYFVSSSNTISSYDLRTGKIAKVLKAGITVGSLAPSPDEKHLLYAVVDHAGGDLLIIDRLRSR